MLKKNKGFTLIELLVVIAIIGILSSVVLASLNTARVKGSDAAIKANLSSIRAQAEILYDTHGAYGVDSTPTVFAEGVCAATADTLFADSTISQQITAAGNASTGGGIGVGRCVVTTSGAAWAVSVPLKSVSTNAWCVDSGGASKEVTAGDAGITAAGACN
ncbi:MAG: type II secretion system protein [Candidatus Pacebacteria bacterium]|nr:type II secretion system protein [Candidatus Paceibacterota bacterium]